MQNKKRASIILLIASAVALMTIAAGALFLVAPVFQPFYHTVEYTPPNYWADENEDEQSNSAGNTIIDLNSATAEQLTALKGIGESKSKAIVEYRSAHGGFTSPQDVTQVSGISQSMVESWAGQVCIGTPETANK